MATSVAPAVSTRPRVLGFACLMVLAWVAVPALINPGQQGDHFEQFTWAHSMEWGYHKHPPFPTWLLSLAVELLGPTPYAAYLVAAALTCTTALFTFGIARRLLDERAASLALLLWGLQWAFTWKAQLLNHNTAMMACVATTAWLALQAADRHRAWGWWVAVGLAAGCGLLSKYQTAVPLVGVILALWRGGQLRRPDQWGGLLVAVAISILVFAPHIVWVVQHDFVTLRYASSTVHQLDAVGRVAKLLSFSVLQLRMQLLALICLGLLLLWERLRPAPAPQEGVPVDERQRRAWLLGLLAWPLLVLAALCLVQGMRLQDHWGLQAMQFLGLWLAGFLRGRSMQALPRLLTIALLAHAVALVTYSRSVWDPRTLAGRDRPDQFYPAQALADDVMQGWQAATRCPLRFVVGPTYEAGMASVYSGQNPVILEMGDRSRSPWVDPAALARDGGVYFWHDKPEALPAGAQPLRQRSFHVPGRETSAYDFYWAVVPPAQGC